MPGIRGKIVDHITVLEGILQMNSDRKVIEREIKEIKGNCLEPDRPNGNK